jgi:hypothetical protein
MNEIGDGPQWHYLKPIAVSDQQDEKGLSISLR